MSKADISGKFDSLAKFADLSKFVDAPVNRLSRGYPSAPSKIPSPENSEARDYGGK
jgi:hypothetical protein